MGIETSIRSGTLSEPSPWPTLAESLKGDGGKILKTLKKWLGITSKKERKNEGEKEKKEKESAAALLVKLATEAGVELFHSLDQVAYALVPCNTHKETWSLKSTGFRRWLARLFYSAEDKTAPAEAVSAALATLRAAAPASVGGATRCRGRRPSPLAVCPPGPASAHGRLLPMGRGVRASDRLATRCVPGRLGTKWLKHVADDGRVYASFYQIGTDTGRMSCSDPNLQQIPNDLAYRRCFRAPEGKVLVKADYSQIELRITCRIAGERNMRKAYDTGADLHRITAQKMTGREEVTKEERAMAKPVNFGMIYGLSPEGLKRKAKTRPEFVGWYRPNSRSPWRPVCHGPSADIVLNKLLVFRHNSIIRLTSPKRKRGQPSLTLRAGGQISCGGTLAQHYR